MAKEKIHNESVNCDEEFVKGDANPSCDVESCANVADETSTEADTMTDSAEQQAAEPDLAQEVAEWRDKFVRLQAEFDNYRKRTLREKMDLVQSGGADVLKAVLPVLDDVNRAVEAMQKSDDVEALREGVKLITLKFEEMLRSKGVTEIEAKGENFNEELHDAVAKFAAGDENKGKVIDVVQRGYMLGDKVLRFAKVVVGE